MDIQFPELAQTNCKFFRACGQLLSATKQHREILHAEKDMKWMRARAKVGKSPQYIYACFGGSQKTKTDHVHIDLTSVDYYEKKRDLPGTSVPLSRIKKVLGSFEGQEIGVRFEAQFASTPDNLPKLVKSTKFSTSSGGMSISTFAVSFSVENAPIDSIAWVESADGGTVWTIIQANMKATVNETYLTRAFELLAATFDKFVMGKTDV